MRKPWRQRYEDHIRSAYWRELKAKVIRRRGNRCERCGCADSPLELHHNHYKTMGRERLKDVALLCRPCHKEEDRQRAIRGRISVALHRVDAGTCSLQDVELLTATIWRQRDPEKSL